MHNCQKLKDARNKEYVLFRGEWKVNENCPDTWPREFVAINRNNFAQFHPLISRVARNEFYHANRMWIARRQFEAAL